MQGSNQTQTLEEIIHGITSKDPCAQLSSTHAARRILSRERSPPIAALIEAGVVTPLVNFLSQNSK